MQHWRSARSDVSVCSAGQRTQVMLIQVLDPVGEQKVRHEDQIEFGDEPALFFRIVLREPLDFPPFLAGHAAVGCHDASREDVGRAREISGSLNKARVRVRMLGVFESPACSLWSLYSMPQGSPTIHAALCRLDRRSAGDMATLEAYVIGCAYLCFLCIQQSLGQRIVQL